MMIYTNNNGLPEWAHHIISYFESKIKYKLIDQLIEVIMSDGVRSLLECFKLVFVSSFFKLST